MTGAGRRDRSRSRSAMPHERFVGTVEKRGRVLVAEPIFERGGQIGLPKGAGPAREGQMALVDMRGGRPSVVRNLGDPSNPRAVVDALLWHRLPGRGFKRVVEVEAKAAVDHARHRDFPRTDLTALPTFTVDPASARDFDDAISAEADRDSDGVRIWVHIADVAAHVKAGGRLDQEALRRATSVYAPGTVEPMLPRVLSDEACSLVPGETRLAVTVETVLAPDGSPRSASFYRSLIRSDARLDYDQLDELFAGRGQAPSEVAEPLRLARQAAASLRERRRSGALEINSAEPEFEFDAEGEVVAARSVAQTESHGLIEQLMIMANERVAEHCVERRVPSIFRIHEQPDTLRVEALLDKLEALGVPTPPAPETMTPTEAGRIAVEASRQVATEAERRGHGREALTSLVLRSLKQAAYSPENLGHAGLGSHAYSHFTSPIRRYPDIVTHRALLASVAAGEEAPEPLAVHDAAWMSSEREREAAKIERSADDICASFLLAAELADRGRETSFEGEVVGLVRSGAFIRFAGERADVYEGFLPLRRIPDDHYDLDETETRLEGRRGNTIRLGDPVEVQVDAIEAPRGRVDLSPPGYVDPRESERRGGAAPSGPRKGRPGQGGPRKGKPKKGKKGGKAKGAPRRGAAGASKPASGGKAKKGKGPKGKRRHNSR